MKAGQTVYITNQCVIQTLRGLAAKLIRQVDTFWWKAKPEGRDRTYILHITELSENKPSV